MKARYLLSTCMGAIMAISASSVVNAASMETELSNMLVEHPRLKAAQKTEKGTAEDISVASAGNLPTVSLNSDYGYEWITNASERGNSDNKNDSSMMRRVAGITVTQNLFDGFATDSSIKTAELTHKETALTTETTMQSLLHEGISAYINVLKQVRRIEFARENEANIKKQMELEDARVQRGSGIGIDVLNAKSRLQTAKDKRVEYEGALELAIDTYMQVFNHAPDIAAMVDPNPPMDMVPETLEDAIKLALTNNTGLLATQIAIDKADESKRTINAEYYPTVDLTGSMNYENDKNATAGTRRDWSVLVEANWDLFTGFSTDYSAKKAIFDYESSKETHRASARSIIEATRQAWHTMETTRERAELKENDVVLKEEIFLSTRKQRETGAEGVDVLNVLDREKEVYEAKITYAELFYDTRLAAYTVLFASGRLTPETLTLEN